MSKNKKEYNKQKNDFFMKCEREYNEQVKELVAKRKSLGLYRSNMAELCGITDKTLHNFETLQTTSAITRFIYEKIVDDAYRKRTQETGAEDGN